MKFCRLSMIENPVGSAIEDSVRVEYVREPQGLLCPSCSYIRGGEG